MRFLFVDHITEQVGSLIRGTRHFDANEPLRYPAAGGSQRIAPGIISEAIGQLASWKCINENDFNARPVFLFADEIESYGDVAPGTTVALEAEVHEANAETFRFSGRAFVQGQLVQVIKDCSGYFMPLAELEDPDVARSRYQALTNGGLTQVPSESSPYNFFDLIGDDYVVSGDSITAKVKLRTDEPFYADHFPRMPVTPIVVINELIGAVSCILEAGKKARSLSVRHISGIKIKSFVRPGDELEIKVTLRDSSGEPANGSRVVHTVADIFNNGKRILRGNYSYIAEEGL